MSRRRNAAAKCATFAAGAPMDRQQSGEQPHASVAAGRSPPARLDIHAVCGEERAFTQSQYRFPPIPPAFWGRALWLVVVGIFAAGLVLLRQTEFGPGLTADSAIYVATGRNLFAGEGFVSVFGPFERYPPLYPLVIAATGHRFAGVRGVD